MQSEIVCRLNDVTLHAHACIDKDSDRFTQSHIWLISSPLTHEVSAATYQVGADCSIHFNGWESFYILKLINFYLVAHPSCPTANSVHAQSLQLSCK